MALGLGVITLIHTATSSYAIDMNRSVLQAKAVAEEVSTEEIQDAMVLQESSIDWIEHIEITRADSDAPSTLLPIVAGNVGIVKGYELLIDGVSYGILEKEDAAEKLLEEIVEEYASPEAGQKIEIVQPIEVKETYVLRAQLVDELNVKTSLFPEEENGNPVFDVKKSRTETTTSEIPFETVEYESKDYYKGKKKTTQEGKVGSLETQTLYVEINGVAQEPVVLQETVVEEAVTEKIAIGTKAYPKGVATGSFIRPAKGRISSYFGPRWGSFHYGIDIANSTGTSIIAADGGTVTKAQYQGSYGNYVIINHGNGKETVYAHLSRIGVSVGQKVNKGDYIGKMGSTGRSTGPHLHFEVRVNGVKKNPMNYL